MLYLVAGNGAPNFGDELIVKLWLQFYRDAGYTGPIVVDGKGAVATKKLLGHFDNVEFRKVFIPRHKQKMDGNYLDFAYAGYEFANNNLDAFRSVKAIHFLGGGYTNSSWPNVTRLLGGAAEIARKIGIPIVATGLGLDPFLPMDSATRKVWAEIIGCFSFFECRDYKSWSKMMEITEGNHLGITHGLDDCFLYPVHRDQHAGRWLHLSGFSEKGILGKGGHQFLSDLMTNFDQTVFWTCSESDFDTLTALQSVFPHIKRVSNFDLLRYGVPIEENDFMITLRFHPHLLAARSGISGYYFYFSKFYETKHNMVLDLGSGFKKMGSHTGIFEGRSENMVAADKARVEEKNIVARKVFAHLGL